MTSLIAPESAPTRHTLTRLWGLLLTGLYLMLWGCTPQPPLRVGVIAWPGYEPLFLAAADGRLPENQIQIVEQPAATDVMRMLRNGVLDAAYLTLDEALSLIAEGVKLEVILVADRSRGADAVLIRPPRDSLADLKGSRVGVENSAVGATMLAAALDRAGLAPADIHLEFIPGNQHEGAYREGLIDALVTFEPVRSSLLEKGARQIFDSSLIPDRILDVLVATPVATSREKPLRTMVAAHFHGVDLLRDQPDRAAAIIAKRWQIPAQAVASRYQGLDLVDLMDNRRLLGGSTPPLERLSGEIAAQMQGQQLLAATPSLSGLATARYLPTD